MITVIQIRKQTQSKTIEANQTGNRQKSESMHNKTQKGTKNDEGRGERVQWLVVGVKVSAGPR